MPSDSNLAEWQSRIEDLRAKGFIDMHTRFVYVSLNVYNVATVHPNPNPNPNPDPNPNPNPNPYPNQALLIGIDVSAPFELRGGPP